MSAGHWTQQLFYSTEVANVRWGSYMLRSWIAGILVSLPLCSLAQKTDGTKPIAISLHITSVHQEDDSTACGNIAACSATKFTVEGYADDANTSSRTVYVLTCDQLIAFKPTTRIAVSCGSVHANNDYEVRVFDASISFWPVGKYTPPPHRGLYSIVSEKEVRKP